jgi:endonuclease/exonuclease/phosphatase family metal-dependent hydrolase
VSAEVVLVHTVRLVRVIMAAQVDRTTFPVRLSVTTFNVWGDKFWPERALPLTQTLQTMRSDVYLLQEVTPAMIEYLDSNLRNYKRVVDKKIGWTTESNIYWNNELLEVIDYGRGDMDITNYPNRCLFWVRLAVRANPTLRVFFSTAHFPWAGDSYEIETGVNQRIPAALKVCEHFRRLVLPQECAIFGGDVNDDYHPIRILSEEVGLIDVFESLDLPPPITHPVRPSDPQEEMRPNRTLDWILCSLPSQCRVVGAFAKTVRGGAHVPVSDHLPVMAFFEIR